jgi:hypothetical protein
MQKNSIKAVVMLYEPSMKALRILYEPSTKALRTPFKCRWEVNNSDHSLLIKNVLIIDKRDNNLGF